MSAFFQDQIYTDIDFTIEKLPSGEYDQCRFIHCNFSEKHLSNYTFLECDFEDCNFTNTRFGGTTLNQITFTNCKMTGVDLSSSNDFMLSINFTNCILDLANCFQLNLSNTHFKDCSLKETDFTESTLTNAIFSECNLKGAIFENTQLQKADFTSARNFSIHPEKNRLTGALFSRTTIDGLVQHLKIRLK